MKAIVNTGPGKIEVQDVPVPSPSRGSARIKTAACGICATDLEMIDGCKRSKYPQILGHEWSGVVDAVGDGVDETLIGSPCVAENVLTDGGEVGFEHPGGYGEYFITEARNVQVLPGGFPMTTAAMIEPLAVSVRAMKRLRLEDKTEALILGDGPIGLIMLMLLKRAGVGVVALVGGRNDRLDLAKKLGAANVINYHEIEGDLAASIRDGIGGKVTNVIEASGSPDAMQACLDLTKPCGHILMLGDYATARADFPWLHVLHNEFEIIGSNASAGAWPEAVKIATSNGIPLEKLVTQTFPPEDAEKGIGWMKSRKHGVIKIVMDWTM